MSSSKERIILISKIICKNWIFHLKKYFMYSLVFVPHFVDILKVNYYDVIFPCIIEGFLSRFNFFFEICTHFKIVRRL